MHVRAAVRVREHWLRVAGAARSGAQFLSQRSESSCDARRCRLAMIGSGSVHLRYDVPLTNLECCSGFAPSARHAAAQRGAQNR
eukprot:4541042-Prymnesium_polylepis.2